MFFIHIWWTITSVTNAFYGITSGWLGDLTLLGAATGGLTTYYRHSRCHIDGCRKHGRYPFKHYRLCRNHHPHVPATVTHVHILKLHKQDIKPQGEGHGIRLRKVRTATSRPS